MRAIKFDQANINLAENQDEYETVPIWMDINENGKPRTVKPTAQHPEGTEWADPQGQAICCFELSDEEVADIIKTRRIWYTQLTFLKPFHPMHLSTQTPFQHA